MVDEACFPNRFRSKEFLHKIKAAHPRTFSHLVSTVIVLGMLIMGLVFFLNMLNSAVLAKF